MRCSLLHGSWDQILRRCPSVPQNAGILVVLVGIGIPIINLRQSSDHLRFIKGIPIPIRQCLLVNRGSGKVSIQAAKLAFKIILSVRDLTTLLPVKFQNGTVIWNTNLVALRFHEILWWTSCWIFMITSSNWNIFRVTGPLCREFTGRWWIPRTKASDAELWCFLWSASE